MLRRAWRFSRSDDAIKTGQSDIDERHIRPQPQDQLDAREAVSGLVHLVTVQLEEDPKRKPPQPKAPTKGTSTGNGGGKGGNGGGKIGGGPVRN